MTHRLPRPAGGSEREPLVTRRELGPKKPYAKKFAGRMWSGGASEHYASEISDRRYTVARVVLRFWKHFRLQFLCQHVAHKISRMHFVDIRFSYSRICFTIGSHQHAPDNQQC